MNICLFFQEIGKQSMMRNYSTWRWRFRHSFHWKMMVRAVVQENLVRFVDCWVVSYPAALWRIRSALERAKECCSQPKLSTDIIELCGTLAGRLTNDEWWNSLYQLITKLERSNSSSIIWATPINTFFSIRP